MEIVDWKAWDAFDKAYILDSILFGMGYAPKVVNCDHKELDISPTERYSD